MNVIAWGVLFLIAIVAWWLVFAVLGLIRRVVLCVFHVATSHIIPTLLVILTSIAIFQFL